MAAERIREAVAASGAEAVDGRLVPLTISAGVACLVDETDGRGLFRAADSALLAAKRAGRDRVTPDLGRAPRAARVPVSGDSSRSEFERDRSVRERASARRRARARAVPRAR